MKQEIKLIEINLTEALLYRENGKELVEKIKTVAVQLKQLMINERYYLGYDWQFSQQQYEKLIQYHNANKLLVNSLISRDVSEEVRQEMKQSLWLPKFPSLPEITIQEKAILDQLEEKYINQSTDYSSSEKLDKLEEINVLLNLAGFGETTFWLKIKPVSENNTEDPEDIQEVPIFRLTIQEQFIILLFQQNFIINDALEITRLYTSKYVIPKRSIGKPNFVMVTDGINFLFPVIPFQELEQKYNLSNFLSLLPSPNKLYNVLRILKRINELLSQ